MKGIFEWTVNSNFFVVKEKKGKLPGKMFEIKQEFFVVYETYILMEEAFAAGSCGDQNYK